MPRFFVVVVLCPMLILGKGLHGCMHPLFQALPMGVCCSTPKFTFQFRLILPVFRQGLGRQRERGPERKGGKAGGLLSGGGLGNVTPSAATPLLLYPSVAGRAVLLAGIRMWREPFRNSQMRVGASMMVALDVWKFWEGDWRVGLGWVEEEGNKSIHVSTARWSSVVAEKGKEEKIPLRRIEHMACCSAPCFKFFFPALVGNVLGICWVSWSWLEKWTLTGKRTIIWGYANCTGSRGSL